MRFANLRGGAFWTKPVIIFILLLILLIPLSFISSLVNDRTYVRSEAVESIMTPVGGMLRINGPLLSVPFKKRVDIISDNGQVKSVESVDQILITPQSYELNANLSPKELKRGIFSVPIFDGEIAMNANFAPLNLEHLGISEEAVLFSEATLIFGIGSTKSLTAFPAINAQNRPLEQSFINPKYSPFSQSVFYKLPSELLKSGFNIDGALVVQGGAGASFTPLAKDNKFKLKSSWNSPSFSGGWLPKNRRVSSSGFDASWEISGLSTAFAPAWIAGDKGDFRFENIDTLFISPINNYSLMARCVAYAILFLAVPFLAIFLCEIYSKMRIHPVQYLLIGIADAIFYLLTLSISEHLSFALSYLIASIAVCVLVLLYAGAIFRAYKWGLFIALVQAVSYCLLYGILHSEDYALLMGSLMIFGVIALVMYLTRKIDWYEKPNG